ncbi:MAG: hypothetical protein IJO79_02075 [Firmicutes bacterium]|nr:hypothetical protein [Bacillota bacterium]
MVFAGAGCGHDSSNPSVGFADSSPSQGSLSTEMEASGQPADSGLGEILPLDFVFSSGAGAWGTALTIYPDGSFVGEYHDSEMGDIGEGYPHGTVYTSKFSGHFDAITSIDKNSFSLKLGDLTLEKEPGEEWIEEQIRYISAEAHGVDGGEEFILYKPGTPVDGLNEDFLHWWPGSFVMEGEEPLMELDCWGLWNVNTSDGFFTFAME